MKELLYKEDVLNLVKDDLYFVNEVNNLVPFNCDVSKFEQDLSTSEKIMLTNFHLEAENERLHDALENIRDRILHAMSKIKDCTGEIPEAQRRELKWCLDLFDEYLSKGK